jgi:hypothetical protein
VPDVYLCFSCLSVLIVEVRVCLLVWEVAWEGLTP